MKNCDTIRLLVLSAALVLLSAACPAQEEGSSREDSGGHKTGDGITGEAPGVRAYAALGEECCGEDPHPVHGTQAANGSYILCGKSIDADGNADGFLVNIETSSLSGTVFLEENAEASYVWSTTFGSAGQFDAANGVAALENAVLMAGVQTVSGRPQRALNKYALETGALLWSATFHAPTAGRESAFESIAVTSGGGVVVAGFVNGEPDGIEGFKSYGNPISGEANVMFFSAEQLAGNDAPESPAWEKTYDLVSIRSIRPVGEDGFVFVAAEDESIYVVVRLDAEGGEEWRTVLTDHGEATDVAVLTDNSGFMISGHKDINSGIDGSITKLDANGSIQWGRTFGNPAGGVNEFAGLSSGDPMLIYDECWGLQPAEGGGAVVACGTGIEDCEADFLDVETQLQCAMDPRVKWRSFIFHVNPDGDETWTRADSYYFPDDPGEGAATASEFLMKADNGEMISVMDQDFGIGLMILEP